MSSVNDNCIFLHIPKCGGTSLRRVLETELNQNKYRCYNHLEYEYIPNAEKSFVFTFVRNPWSRILSLYMFWKNQTPEHMYYKYDKKQVKYITKNRLDFKGFINEIAYNKESIFHEKRHINPYIGSFFQNPEKLDYIGRVENMQNDFDTLCDLIKINPCTIPHENQSGHNNYIKYYDSETRDIVANLYADDIEYFRYKFDE